jgi:hypothetical protein
MGNVREMPIQSIMTMDVKFVTEDVPLGGYPANGEGKRPASSSTDEASMMLMEWSVAGTS